MRLESSVSRSGVLHGGIVFLAVLASAAFCMADADGNRPSRVVWLTIIGQAVITAGAAVYFRRLQLRSPATIALSPLLLAVMGGSYLWEPISRWAFGSGRPFEALVMFSLNNVMLAMAAVSCWRNYSVWTLVASMFVMMFSAAMTTSREVQVIIILYAAGAVTWLAIAYWESLRQRLIATDRQKTFSRRWMVIGTICVVALLMTVHVSDNRALSSLAGWLPSSGGNGEFDPFSRGGVGDGDALVAGTENITSFAPIDDAPFLQDDQPSLYDIFDDTYEEAAPPKRQDRAVSLPPELASRIKEHLHTRTQKAAREFSTLRKSTEHGQNVKDIRSDALFYVAGRTPLHLRLEVFDLFDGITWYAEPSVEFPRPVRLVERDGRVWVDACQFSPAHECFVGPESHAIKVVNMDTNRIPAPLHLTGIHIADVDRADLFSWAQKDIVQMERKRLPALVPIHLTSAVLDRSALQASRSLGFNRNVYRAQITSSDMSRIEKLAASWVNEIPAGWPQVVEIEKRLREGYDHDREVITETEEMLPVARFLFEDRRGPDYQFATAAAVMLRSLGYSTRVVSGFYADPEKYDLRSRHTPVHKDDVHFWVEVYLGANTWATVEPTPGYEILEPPPGLWEQAQAMLLAFGRWLIANALAVSLFLATAALLFVRRFDLLDVWYTLRWRLVPATDLRRKVIATWQLIDWRMTSSGWQRLEGQTPQRWLAAGGAAETPFRKQLHDLIRLIEWATFAPDGVAACDSPSQRVAACDMRSQRVAACDMRSQSVPPATDTDIAALCRSTVRYVTRNAIQRSQQPMVSRHSRRPGLLSSISRWFYRSPSTQLTNG